VVDSATLVGVVHVVPWVSFSVDNALDNASTYVWAGSIRLLPFGSTILHRTA
jgi:hypothetical protein